MTEDDSKDLTTIISRRLKDAEERGYARGLEAGKQIGREEERKSIRKTVTEARAELQDISQQLLEMQDQAKRFLEQLQISAREKEAKPRDKDIVLSVIKRTGGLTGQQLVERCEKEGTPVRERSLRTSLHRLKKSGDIYKNGDGWFARDPAAPSLTLLKEEPSGET